MEISFLIYFFIFLFGTAVGSFLNVVIYRLGTELSIAKGRSKCFSCLKELRWFDLIPLFSFLFLRGQCRRCKARISPQYFLVEVFTGLVFVVVFWKVASGAGGIAEVLSFSWIVLLILYLSIWSILLAIFVYDLRHKIIPDGLSFSFAGLALLAFFTQGLAFHSQGLALGSLGSGFWWDLSAGPILFLPFFLFWFLSGGRLMGFGDAKLAVGMGFLLGLSGGISAIILAFWVGALISVSIIFTGWLLKIFGLRGESSGLGLKSEIPFGPFLILGTALVFFTEIDIWGIVSFLSF